MLITVFCCVHHAAHFINNVFDCVKKEECAVVTSSALTWFDGVSADEIHYEDRCVRVRD